MKYLIYLVTIIGFFLVNPLLSEHLIQQKSTESLNDSQNIDKNILIELFETTNGYNWTKNDGWLSSNISYCQWYGVICDSNSNVGSLSLRENHLFGLLPDSIGNLQAIRLLDLGSNLLTGTIPESIGQLTRVQYLAFDSNQLSGSIPSSIGGMVSLLYLELGENQLFGSFPESIVRLVSLRIVDLHQNQLSGTIPDNIGRLTNLQNLNLDSNQFSGTIPRTIGQLVNLQELDLNSNLLTGTIPDNIGQGMNLRHFYMNSNQLTGTIPNSITSLAVLQALSLSSNQLTGTIPDSIGKIGGLQILDLKSNQLNGTIPDAIGRLGVLQYLSIGSNRILGTVPNSLWTIKGLQELYLDGNGLNGTISDAVGDLRALRRLALSDNNFEGTLPNLDGLSLLESIVIANNNFHGCLSLPSQFVGSSNTSCQLDDNNFCCAKDNYDCFEASCIIDGTLIIASGATVKYLHSPVNRNIVVKEGGVLVLESTSTIDVDCFTLEGELQVATNTSLDSVTLVRSTCQTISPVPKITTSSPYCEPKIFLVFGDLRGSIVCTIPEDNSQRDTIIIVVSVIVGSVVLSGAIVLIVLIRRRRQRIDQLKARVELLTVSTASTNKRSSPPEEFKFKLLEDMPIKISKTSFKFGHQGNLFIVEKESIDSFTVEVKNTKHHVKKKVSLYESLISKRTLVQFRPIRSSKYKLAIEPQGFELPHGASVEVTLRLTLTMTTKTKVSYWVELPEEQVYSLIEFDVASEPSPWIDVDEIEVEGEAVGEGGFGAVYKAHYRGQQVAYKTLKFQELGDQFYKEFEQEVRMMMNLHHKNIIQFIGASRVKGKLAILTEFVSQGNLSTLLSSKALNTEVKKKIILDTAEALLFLHANNILHRDIKAENLLVISTLKEAIVNVKLTDFGTARSTTEQVTSKFTKGVGTPIYMAIEILKNETYEKSADVYSFGVLMWTIMTQEEPYKEMTHSWDIAEFVLQGKRLPIPADCPALLRDLITKCWAQNPQDRPTMKEIVSVLSNDEDFVELD